MSLRLLLLRRRRDDLNPLSIPLERHRPIVAGFNQDSVPNLWIGAFNRASLKYHVVVDESKVVVQFRHCAAENALFHCRLLH